MTEIVYRVVPRGKAGFDVEMERPGGRKRTVPGFHSEHEAEAWIVQAKRLIRDASPLAPPLPRKPAGETAAKPPAAAPTAAPVQQPANRNIPPAPTAKRVRERV